MQRFWAGIAALVTGRRSVWAVLALAVAVSGLANPRGFTWGLDGSLYATEAGSGGLPPVGATPVPGAMPSAGGGLTGAVSYAYNGCPVVFEGDLPSTRGTSGSVRGPAIFAFQCLLLSLDR